MKQYFLRFEGETPEEAVKSHLDMDGNVKGYASVQEAISSANYYEEEGNYFEVIDKNGNILYAGKTGGGYG